LTAVYIIAGVLLLLFLLTRASLRFIVSFKDNKLKFEVKYLFITLFPIKKRKKRRKRKKEKTAAPADDASLASLPETEAEEEAEEEPGEGKKTKRSAAEIVELIKSTKEKLEILYGSTNRGIKHLLARMAIENLDIHFIVASDEAAKTGVYYGIISAAVYNAVAFLRPFTTLYIKDLEIIPDFDRTDSVFDISFAVAIRVGSLLSSGLLIGAGMLRDRKKYKGFFKKDKNKQEINENE
jgi:hypothetical protein